MGFQQGRIIHKKRVVLMKNRLIILAVMFLLLGLAVSDIAANIHGAAALLLDFAESFHGGSEVVSLIDEDTPRAVRELNLDLPGEAELTRLAIHNEMGQLKSGRSPAAIWNTPVCLPRDKALPDCRPN